MKIRWNEDKPMLDEIRTELSRAVEFYFAAGDEAFRRKLPWNEVHRFRLESKRFRYTLELFVDFYGRSLNAKIKELKKIQTHLGDINDLVATRSMLKGHSAFKKELRSQAEERMDKLRKHWKDEFAAEGRKELWLAALAKPKLSSAGRSR